MKTLVAFYNHDLCVPKALAEKLMCLKKLSAFFRSLCQVLTLQQATEFHIFARTPIFFEALTFKNKAFFET